MKRRHLLLAAIAAVWVAIVWYALGARRSETYYIDPTNGPPDGCIYCDSAR